MCENCNQSLIGNLRWKAYNLAFLMFGKTRYWKRIGNFLWGDVWSFMHW